MLFESVLFFTAALVGFAQLGYPLITSLKRRTLPRKKRGCPGVTLVIPVLNEEKLIEEKLRNTLNIDYPKDRVAIIVVDDGSTDRTAELAGKFPVKVVNSKGKGKIMAVNTGIGLARTEIVVLTDADTEIERGSIKNLVSCLSDDIGAVNGNIIPKLPPGPPSKFLKQKKIYRTFDWALRSLEGQIDSVCSLDAKLLAFRKSCFPGFDEDTPLDDYQMTFEMRKKNMRCIVATDAIAYEALSGCWSNEIEQFTRYSKGTILLNLKYSGFLFNPKFGYFGLMTFPFRRFFPTLYPLLAVIMVLCLLPLAGVSGLIVLLGLSIVSALLFPLAFLQFISILLSYWRIFTEKATGSWTPIRHSLPSRNENLN
jgi:poly-beta-1,6-N-acetyl-D-glucosamine synthase